MIKEIKPVGTVRNAIVLVNDNFKELGERLKKVEKKLKIKKMK